MGLWVTNSWQNKQVKYIVFYGGKDSGENITEKGMGVQEKEGIKVKDDVPFGLE